MRHAVRRRATRWSLAPLLLVLAASCSDSRQDGGNPLAPGAAPQLDVADAARGDGTPGFYFLSPIAPALASYPGEFTPDAQPTVEVCEWSGSACVQPLVARYTRAEGTGGRTIVMDATSQSYRVDWPIAGIATGKLYRIRVLDGIWELGHADAKRPAAGESPATLKAQGIVPLGNAATFAIRFRIERNEAPLVAITAPANNAVLPAGSAVTLAGEATDAEEGDLSAQIVWRSSRVPTPLGTGATLSVALAGGKHTLSASVTDQSGRTTTASIDVVASIVSGPATLNVPFGATASLPITLAEPAPAGGLTLTVATSAPGIARTTTETITIPEGARSANVTVEGVAPGGATVTVSNADYGSAATPVTVTAQLDITATSVSFARGRTGEITIELESGGSSVAAPAGGLVVALTSADPTCAVSAPTVTIPEGLVSTTASIVYGGTAATPCSTTITASAAEVAGVASDVVTANVGAAPSLSIGSTRVGAGLQTSLTITLGAAAPAGGLDVAVTSSDASVLHVSASETASGSGSAVVHVAAGATSGTVYLQGVPGRSGPATLTATASGYTTATGAQTVAPIAVEIASLSSSTTTFSANNAFYVRVGALNAAGTGISSHQDVRPGAGALVVTLANSNAAVGQLVRAGETGQSLTVQIAEGEANSPTSVASGGIAFDPLNAGTTTVTATAPGVTPIAGASQSVTVSAPATSIGSTRVGAGLQTSLSVNLGAGAPAGLQITVTSSDPGKLLLASSASAATGSASLTLDVASGASSATVYLRGVPGASGTASVTVAAPGYAGGSSVQTIAPIALDIASLSSSATTLSANNAFYVRVGVLNAAGTAIASHQSVQGGAGPLTVTVTNSDATVAQLVRTGGAAQSVTVQIPEGASNSPTSVAAGGVALDPIGGGTTTVTASAPGIAPIAASSQTVTVSAPAMSIGGTRVGAGLQTSVTVGLGAAAPAGGVTVTVANSNPAVLRVANAADVVGGATTTLTIPAGSSSATLYLQGVPGTSGAATLSVSAPGFTGASAVETVAPFAVEITGLASSTTTLSANDPFQVRVGVVNAAGTAISAHQSVQPGGGPLLVSLASSSSSVAALVSSSGYGSHVNVQIPVGESITPASVAAGGAALDPLGSGSTTITASAWGAQSIAAASQVVAVTAPALTVGGTRVGAGLQTSVTINLGAPAPAGGLAVAVTSSNAGVLRVSSASDVLGGGTATVTIPAAGTSGTVYVQGVVGASGTATVTVAAPGYTNGTAAQTVAAPALELVNLSSSTTAAAANDAFHVRVGVPNAAGTSITAQAVHAGAAPLTVALTSSNAAVAQLVRGSTAGQSVTVQIAAGENSSPTTVASGGAALDPLAAGSTTVTATAGAIGAAPASQVVTVNP